MTEKDTGTGQDLFCGIVRPIAAMGNYSSGHWSEVGEILDDAIHSAGFEPRLVSEASSTGIIHARIVANLYRDDMIVCDISGKNPNVMLELGMRLAFDKPVVVIKDDVTDYSFDTSPIEHLSYPSSLHYPSIVEFKGKLVDKIKSTHDNYDISKSFLQQFGPIKVAEIKEVKVPGYELVREEIGELRVILQSMQARQSTVDASPSSFTFPDTQSGLLLYKKRLPDDVIDEVMEKASKLSPVDKINIGFGQRGMTVRVKPDRLGGWDQREANDAVRDLLRKYLVRVPMPKEG